MLGLHEWLRFSRVRGVAKFCAQPPHAWEARLPGALHRAGHQSSRTCAEPSQHGPPWDNLELRLGAVSALCLCRWRSTSSLCRVSQPDTTWTLAQRYCQGRESVCEGSRGGKGVELRSVSFLMILFREFNAAWLQRAFQSTQQGNGDPQGGSCTGSAFPWVDRCQTVTEGHGEGFPNNPNVGL